MFRFSGQLLPVIGTVGPVISPSSAVLQHGKIFLHDGISHKCVLDLVELRCIVNIL